MAIFDKLNKFLDTKIIELSERLENRHSKPQKTSPQERRTQPAPTKGKFARPTFRPGRTLPLMVTEKCNLRCTYCLRNTGDNGKEIPFPVLKRIILSAHRFGIRDFSITGGEILVYPYWRELIKLIGSLKSSVFIETNGFSLKEEDVVFLKNTLNNRISKILVSLDSYRSDVHDKFRGKGAFNRAVRAIKLLRKYNIPIEVNALLTPLNFMNEEDILNYIKFNKKLGVREIVLGEAVGLGRAKNSRFLLNENQRRQISQILAKHNYFKGEGAINFRPGGFFISSGLQPCHRLGVEIAVSPYGLHPCIFQIDTIKIGDFGDLEKLLYSNFLDSLYWTGAAMQECFKKEIFFSCAKCIKYLPEWLSRIKKDTFLNPKQNEKN